MVWEHVTKKEESRTTFRGSFSVSVLTPFSFLLLLFFLSFDWKFSKGLTWNIEVCGENAGTLELCLASIQVTAFKNICFVYYWPHKMTFGEKNLFHFLIKKQQWKVGKPQTHMLVQGATCSNILWAFVLVSIHLEMVSLMGCFAVTWEDHPIQKSFWRPLLVLCRFQTLMKPWNMGEV